MKSANFFFSPIDFLVAQFNQRKTYRYRYEVKMEVRKDRDLPLARAGIKIASDVLVSSPTNNSIILKVTQIKCLYLKQKKATKKTSNQYKQ